MTDFVVVWEYHCFGSKWLEYDKDLTNFLNGLSGGVTDADRQIVGWQMRFDLQQMRQHNMDAGYARNIRCALRSSDEGASKIVWRYQGKPRKRWISFPPELAIQLEKCYMNVGNSLGDEQKIEFTLNGKDVQVDMAIKMMTFLDSEEESALKREESTAGPPDSADPPHPKSSPTAIRERNRRITEEVEKKKKGRKSKGESGKEKKEMEVKKKRNRKKKKKVQENVEEEGELEEMEMMEGTEVKKKGNRKEKKIQGSDDDEDEGEEEEAEMMMGTEVKKKRNRKKKKVQGSDEEEEEEEMEMEDECEGNSKENAPTKSKRRRVESSDEEDRGMEEEANKEQTIGMEETFIKKATLEEAEDGTLEAEVDIECRELIGKAKVYVDKASGMCYDVMLNQTNIQQNNNKFYLMQVLKSNVEADYWVWFRWGRVGLRGQSSLTPFGADIEKSLAMFSAKFRDKTKNDFITSKTNFQKIAGKYDMIRIDYSRKVVKAEMKMKSKEDGGLQNEENEPEVVKETNKMDERVRALMNMICDLKALESDARKLDYDFKRIPLGKITKEQIHAGYEALTRIEQHIQNGKFGQDFTEAVNSYYTRIPHSFGMRTPPMIKTMEDLKKEIELLELLTGIEITVTEMGGDPMERHYERLKWELTPLDKEDEHFKIVEEYLMSTHGPTHDKYKLELRNAFELRQKVNADARKAFREELGNRKLLWHGSRLANWYSILAQGLRIAPAEAPSTGYMFGKGAYFADISTKSANYSLSDSDRPGFLLLSEVALGSVLDVHEADDQMHRKLPEGKHSVRGVGRYIPHPDGTKLIDGCVEVPCGKPVEMTDSSSLIYNEFIIYNLDQIRERFLVEVGYKFEFEL